MFALLITCVLMLVAHPNSLSSTLVRVEGSKASVLMRCQVESIREVLPEADVDGDGRLTLAELEAATEPILEYIGEHYSLSNGADREFRGGTRLQPGGVSVIPTPLEDRPFDPLAWGDYGDWIDVELEYEADAPITDLLVEVSLFFTTSPAHYDVTAIQWEDGASDTVVLSMENPREWVDPRASSTLATFTELGYEHILGGYDHIAFVLALVLSSRSWKKLLGIVTAFTLAHSASLALMALGWINLSEYSEMIEAAIALSIAYVAIDQLLFPALARTRLLEAFSFGLIHGLGFAGFLSDSLINEDRKLVALFGFNLGVELGQLLVVAAAGVALWFLPRSMKSSDDSHLAPKWLRTAGCYIIAAFGLGWFFLRVW